MPGKVVVAAAADVVVANRSMMLTREQTQKRETMRQNKSIKEIN